MASMKGGGRLYLAGAVMLLALTHGTSVAEPSEDSLRMSRPRTVRRRSRTTISVRENKISVSEGGQSYGCSPGKFK
jgi:hypothetical protein